MSEEIRKKEDAELREYQKKSLVVRAAGAVATMVISALAGYYASKLRSK